MCDSGNGKFFKALTTLMHGLVPESRSFVWEGESGSMPESQTDGILVSASAEGRRETLVPSVVAKKFQKQASLLFGGKPPIYIEIWPCTVDDKAQCRIRPQGGPEVIREIIRSANHMRKMGAEP